MPTTGRSSNEEEISTAAVITPEPASVSSATRTRKGLVRILSYFISLSRRVVVERIAFIHKYLMAGSIPKDLPALAPWERLSSTVVRIMGLNPSAHTLQVRGDKLLAMSFPK